MYQGYLWKLKRAQHRIALVPQWNKRWFSIERHLLKWYATPAAEKASGIVDLRFVTELAPFESAGGVFSFVLSYPDRNLLLRASTQGEMEKWMRALRYQSDIVRGGDGTGILNDSNSFCSSPQGKGRAIKDKYRPATLEATLEATMARLEILESEVSKKGQQQGGSSNANAGSSFQATNSKVDNERSRGSHEQLHAEDFAYSENRDPSRKAGQGRSKSASTSKKSSSGRSDTDGGPSQDSGSRFNRPYRSPLRKAKSAIGYKGCGYDDDDDDEMNDILDSDGEQRHSQQGRSRRNPIEAQSSVRHRDSERRQSSSATDDAQSVGSANEMPPQLQKKSAGAGSSRGARGGSQVPGHRGRLAAERGRDNFHSNRDDDDDDDDRTEHCPSLQSKKSSHGAHSGSWGYDDDDVYKDTGSSVEGRVSATQAMALRAAKTSGRSQGSDSGSGSGSGMQHSRSTSSVHQGKGHKGHGQRDQHSRGQPRSKGSAPTRDFDYEGDLELKALEEDIQEMVLTVSTPTRRTRDRQRDREEGRESKDSQSVRSSSTMNGGWFA